MIFEAYVIRCLSNMHVGSGDTTFGVIDNLVQKDPVTLYPVINSSSIKGAFREFFKDNNKDLVEYIFGSENNSKSQKPGAFKFFSAHLLSIPARSMYRPFYSATTPSIFKEMADLFSNFSINHDKAIDKLSMLSPSQGKVFATDENTNIEDYTSTKKEFSIINGITEDNTAIFHDKDFKNIVKYLPVIARNHLENGESKNLWYEEIVPRETKFYFIVGKGNDEKAVSEFDHIITNNIIQIGGNASIGYGYVTIKKLTGMEGKTWINS